MRSGKETWLSSDGGDWRMTRSSLTMKLQGLGALHRRHHQQSSPVVEADYVNLARIRRKGVYAKGLSRTAESTLSSGSLGTGPGQDGVRDALLPRGSGGRRERPPLDL
jgi:hypothetical protein